ncbi:MAG: hypothetical protein ACRCZE_02165 [Candidatus Altimarinota bacterium]
MKKNNTLIILLSIITLTACNPPISTTKPDVPTPTESSTPETESTNDSAQPDQPFSLALGESMIFQPAGLTIQFTEVKSDSRCPSDVVCVWAGEATIHIIATTQGPAVEADLVLGDSSNDSIQLRGDVGGAYNLKFLDLTPYPSSKSPSDNNQYKATFIFQAAK